MIDNYIFIHVCMIVLAPMVYTSRQFSLIFMLFVYAFLVHLIFQSGQIGDILTYVRQLETFTFYTDEFAYSAIQRYMLGTGLDADSIIKWLQFALALLFFLFLGLPFKSGYFVFFPFFHIFVLNSIRQGFATAFMAAGILLLISKRPLWAMATFVLAVGFHPSAVAVAALAGAAYLFRWVIEESSLFIVFFLSVIFIVILQSASSVLPSLLG